MTDLHAAAAAAGLRRDWVDAEGKQQRVADAVLEAILSRLDTSPPPRPFISAEAGVPFDAHDIAPGAELVLEDGAVRPFPVGADGRAAAVDAVGYHWLHSAAGTTMLAVAPRRCPQPRASGWGVAVQVPALRDTGESAHGDLGTLAEAAAAFGRAGCAALAISPTHALFPADPTRFSPYAPSSRAFHNVLLADPRTIGAPPSPAAPAGPLIDWTGTIPARLRHLRGVFDAAGDGVRDALATFRAARGEALEHHARFDALHATLGGRGWQDWPAAFRDPAGEAVQRFAAEHADTVAFYAFLQWLADLGLARAQQAARVTMAIGLIADLAVGIDSGGSHGWSRRSELLDGLTIGAPPDPLGPEGQNWGITALDPFALARTGFAAFAETIRVALAHAGGIRIDHALGLDRLWVIPEGGTAGDGAYLTMPGAHLKRIVAIEAQRARAVVIAEDLGTVPPGFRDDVAARGMLGMRVLPFERDKAGDFVSPARWDRDAVAMTGTHDTATIAGWWQGCDLDWNARLGRDMPATARSTRDAERASLWRAIDGAGPPPADPPVDTILSAVADAPAPLAIVPLEDLLGLTEQPNIPGTIDQHPNWRRRMPADAATLLAQPAVSARAARLTDKRPG